jgi:DNA-binding GntR family transcriptional regulator
MAHAKHGKAACLDDLRRRILTQELEPGAYLDETQLAEGYAISRPPLREVLRQLAGEGYVLLHPNRGAQVAPMTHKTLRNFFVAAPMIYAAVSRLAAMNARPEQIMRLKDTQLLFRGAIRDGDAAARALLNDRFHAIIGEMVGNCRAARSSISSAPQASTSRWGMRPPPRKDAHDIRHDIRRHLHARHHALHRGWRD